MKLSSGMKKLAAQSPTSTSSFKNQNLRGSEMQDGGTRQPPAPSPLSRPVPVVELRAAVRAGAHVEEQGGLQQVEAGGAEADPVHGRGAHEPLAVGAARQVLAQHGREGHLQARRGAGAGGGPLAPPAPPAQWDPRCPQHSQHPPHPH